MKRYRPLLASLIVIGLGMLGIYLLTLEPAEKRPDPLPPRSKTDPREGSHEDEWVETQLEPRQTLDPNSLWPRRGYRVAHPLVWVTWETGLQSQGRLIARGKRTPWYELGHTESRIHYLPLDLAVFDGEVEYKVEFEAFGDKWRSEAKPISYGAGVHFVQRRYRFTLGERGEQRFRVRLEGGDPTRLGAEAFRQRFFPENVITYVIPIEGDAQGGEVYFAVQEAFTVLKPGCIGFLEVFDTTAHTYDQILIELVRE
jgi:hypothetical protein